MHPHLSCGKRVMVAYAPRKMPGADDVTREVATNGKTRNVKREAGGRNPTVNQGVWFRNNSGTGCESDFTGPDADLPPDNQRRCPYGFAYGSSSALQVEPPAAAARLEGVISQSSSIGFSLASSLRSCFAICRVSRLFRDGHVGLLHSIPSSSESLQKQQK